MTITATVHFEVPYMRKTGISSELNILDRMTFAAIPGNRESSFAIMTGAAGFAFLHLCHGVGFTLGSSGKDFVVAIITLVDPDMERMAEYYFTRIRKIKSHIFYAVMASVTTASDTEGDICIMAGTARTVILHFPHGKPATPLATGKNTAVTISADVHVFYGVCMDLMTEKCRDLLEADIRRTLMTFLTIPFY